ncbi:hypothetical protein Rhopal_000363-T1 [Rhodotorula paludigena]|uniref:NTF2 domain-containing protein n=1 Tax=Rhodotorula paludigena TaxID=86838 RepID=A0AAV5GAF4_9BASI|nr:hypothetical protein Rhopal_000363-T1 [Rhodotorula paludigena]
MPPSGHEVQAFDCHPISGSANGATPPSLVVTVTGQVTHGPNPTPAAGSISAKNFDGLARVFSQSFILVFAPTSAAPPPAPAGPGAEQGAEGYVVASDSFRFC